MYSTEYNIKDIPFLFLVKQSRKMIKHIVLLMARLHASSSPSSSTPCSRMMIISQCLVQAHDDLLEHPTVHVRFDLEQEEIIPKAHLTPQHYQSVSGQISATVQKEI